MSDFFNFFDMADDYAERCVANFKKGKLTVDTCAVRDSDWDYETGVQHPEYNNGKWVIVQGYDSKKEALAGHNKWVRIMTGKNLPSHLKDVSTAGIAKFARVLGAIEEIRPRAKGKK